MKKEPITRKEAISACVESYIKNNAAEWILFQADVKKKRGRLIDKQFGVVADDLKAFKRGSTIEVMRQTITLPNKLAQTIALILRSHDQQPAFPMDNKEESWFVKKFSTFLIPDEY